MSLAAKILSRFKRDVHSVALVGMDGSGKSTQVQLLGRGLTEDNKRVVLIHPFGRKLLSLLPSLPTMSGRPSPANGYGRGRPPELRRVAAWLELLDVAAYVWAAHICCLALALFGKREVWLVSDRSFDDLLIKYRHLKVFSPPVLWRLRKLVPATEQTIWLRTEPEVAMRRDREFEPGYYQELHADYASTASELRWQVVSASDRPREAVAAEIAGVLNLTRSPAPPAPLSVANGASQSS